MIDVCKKCGLPAYKGMSKTTRICAVCENVKDGGPAFPRTEQTEMADRSDQIHFGSPGMTLRDWFAGMALQGILSNQSQHIGDLECYFANRAGSKGDNQIPNPSILAEYSYELADAMLKEREVEP